MIFQANHRRQLSGNSSYLISNRDNGLEVINQLIIPSFFIVIVCLMSIMLERKLETTETIRDNSKNYARKLTKFFFI